MFRDHAVGLRSTGRNRALSYLDSGVHDLGVIREGILDATNDYEPKDCQAPVALSAGVG